MFAVRTLNVALHSLHLATLPSRSKNSQITDRFLRLDLELALTRTVGGWADDDQLGEGEVEDWELIITDVTSEIGSRTARQKQFSNGRSGNEDSATDDSATRCSSLRFEFYELSLCFSESSSNFTSGCKIAT